MEPSIPTVESQLEMICRCLGLHFLDPPLTANDSRATPSAVCGLFSVPDALPPGFLLEPRLVYSISCKTKRDRKPCGITDVALTDDGRLFVADFLNKTVKIYDSLQVFIIIILYYITRAAQNIFIHIHVETSMQSKTHKITSESRDTI